MSKEFYIVEEDCILCGTCASICPECFQFDEETMDHAEVISFDCPEDTVQEAIDSCPAQCIFWKDE